ncbi:hypothetical protein [Bacillus sp. Hm123]|uniref:hypothetical protein n=1 Tax=Bacillus sp. Hm123 TaxID=3450745 RepID=UPI003F43F2A9
MTIILLFYPPFPLPSTKEERKQPFRLGRHKMDRRSGVLCHIGVTAYVRESGCWSWTIRRAEGAGQ